MSAARLFLVGLAAALLLALACNSSSTDDTPGTDEPTATDGSAPPTATREPDPAAFTTDEAQQAADFALLVLNDFPTGWTAEDPGVDDDDDDFDLDADSLPPECAVFAGAVDDDDDTVASAVSDDFIGLSDEEISVEIDVFKSPALAGLGFEALAGFIDVCAAPLQEAFGQQLQTSLDEPDEDGETFEVALGNFRFAEIPFPAFGDDSLALGMTFDVTLFLVRLEFEAHIIFVRVGNMAGTFSYVSLAEPPDSAIERRLLGFITDRMTDAAASLAE